MVCGNSLDGARTLTPSQLNTVAVEQNVLPITCARELSLFSQEAFVSSTVDIFLAYDEGCRP
jgi:hypothetical protein